jgi:hypothetical protein
VSAGPVAAGEWAEVAENILRFGGANVLRLMLRTQPRSHYLAKGFSHSAQRWREAATLGDKSHVKINSEEVESNHDGGDAIALWLNIFGR